MRLRPLPLPLKLSSSVIIMRTLHSSLIQLRSPLRRYGASPHARLLEARKAASLAARRARASGKSRSGSSGERTGRSVARLQEVGGPRAGHGQQAGVKIGGQMKEL